ncbi:MAG: hypothetical protein GX221_01010 [Candidatus Riflebacteria bacterium]|nr:hypothetical protein [Candidatus Riflebacteria bacterium]
MDNFIDDDMLDSLSEDEDFNDNKEFSEQAEVPEENSIEDSELPVSADSDDIESSDSLQEHSIEISSEEHDSEDLTISEKLSAEENISSEENKLHSKDLSKSENDDLPAEETADISLNESKPETDSEKQEKQTAEESKLASVPLKTRVSSFFKRVALFLCIAMLIVYSTPYLVVLVQHGPKPAGRALVHGMKNGLHRVGEYTIRGAKGTVVYLWDGVALGVKGVAGYAWTGVKKTGNFMLDALRDSLVGETHIPDAPPEEKQPLPVPAVLPDALPQKDADSEIVTPSSEQKQEDSEKLPLQTVSSEDDIETPVKPLVEPALLPEGADATDIGDVGMDYLPEDSDAIESGESFALPTEESNDFQSDCYFMESEADSDILFEETKEPVAPTNSDNITFDDYPEEAQPAEPQDENMFADEEPLGWQSDSPSKLNLKVPPAVQLDPLPKPSQTESFFDFELNEPSELQNAPSASEWDAIFSNGCDDAESESTDF